MTFTTQAQVRFAHVDGAGIVFYPRYFEMLNGAVEDWFESLGCPFNSMHRQRQMGVPTVKLECEFLAPSELGDVLTIRIEPTRLGQSSCTLNYSVSANGTERLRASGVLVCMNTALKKSMPWPEDLRPRMRAAIGIVERPTLF
ncbi:acyl-CoA thioesterase [Steroidobacter flavus]|uniref:Acyl-CoA thioesterase n=1 Tax=Steroidobacter flavus TaxID=1842136 RepID=A0ABV8SXT3_9GAMM